MSSDMEQGMAEQPDTPRNMSPEELEQALRWLEVISAGRAADAASPDKVLDDSPFRNLFELEEGDLPDWLREAPRGEGTEAGLDMESRLDWLAKMAGRESVDELPTLEWRRLSAQTQEELLGSVVTEEISTAHMLPVQTPAETAAAQPTESATEPAPGPAVTPTAAETIQGFDEKMMMAAALVPLSERPTEPYIRIEEEQDAEHPSSFEPEATTEEQTPMAEEPIVGEIIEPAATAEVVEVADVIEVAALVEGADGMEEFAPAVEEAITEPTLTLEPESFEEQVVAAAAAVVAASLSEDATELPTQADLALPEQSSEPSLEATSAAEAEIPELDDMDAAMAWLEELAANQSTPIEDLPSVADRALASRLMAEASQLGVATMGESSPAAADLPPADEPDKAMAEETAEPVGMAIGLTPAVADLIEATAEATTTATEEAPVVAEPITEITKRKAPRKKSTKDKSSTRLETAAIATAAAAAAAVVSEPAAETPAEVPAAEVVPEPPVEAATVEPVLEMIAPEAVVTDLEITPIVPEVEPEPDEKPTDHSEAPAAALVVAAETAIVMAEEPETPIADAVTTEPAALLSAADQPDWLETPTPTEPLAAAAPRHPAEAPIGRADLSDILDLLDGIAVARQVPLDELEDVLEAEGMAALATPYSLDSTLDWLIPASEPAPLFTAAAPAESTPAAEAVEPIVAAVPLATAPQTVAPQTVAPQTVVPSIVAPIAEAPPAAEATAASPEVPATAAALAPTSRLPLESSLLDEMPDDPDEALDWMRQFAEDEPSEIEMPLKAVGSADVIEFSDSMLMEMPDDPDEAIAWLEKLASQGRPTA